MIEEQLSIGLGEDFAQSAPLKNVNELGVALPMNGLQMGVMEVALLPRCTAECPLLFVLECSLTFGAIIMFSKVSRGLFHLTATTKTVRKWLL